MTVLARPAGRRGFGRRQRDWRRDTPRLRGGRPAFWSKLISISFAVGLYQTMIRGKAAGVSAIASLVLFGFIWLSVRQPRISVIGIVIWVPIQKVVLAYLFHLGAPLPVVRGFGYMKEFWEISLVIVAVREWWRGPRKLEWVDRIAIAFIGLSLFYFILPSIFSGVLGGLNFSTRLNAWRLEAIYIVVFLALRQLTFDAKFLRNLRNVAMVVGIVIGGFAIWEASDHHGFNNFLANTIDLPAYTTAITGVAASTTNVLASTTVGTATVVRSGSLFNDPLTLGFFSLVGLGLALERLSAERLGYIPLVAAGASGAAVILSETRSATLGAGLAIAAAVALGSRYSPGRFRLVLVVGIAAALMVPPALHSSLRDRFTGIFSGSTRDAESQDHVTASRGALHDVLLHPIGRGLGANSSTGARYNTAISTTAEDSYLETAEELGLAGGVLSLLLLVVLLLQLLARSRLSDAHAELAGGLFLAGVALLLGGFFLQVWFELPTSMMFWTLAGVALSRPDPLADSVGAVEDDAEASDPSAELAALTW
ncbi:MAG TPA: O-antigen ligase family protein [Mycobacteriales bacterium]|nr:O-antigen ligase family protein [Mycobacteriales bacterium]